MLYVQHASIPIVTLTYTTAAPPCSHFESGLLISLDSRPLSIEKGAGIEAKPLAGMQDQ